MELSDTGEEHVRTERSMDGNGNIYRRDTPTNKTHVYIIESYLDIQETSVSQEQIKNRLTVSRNL